MPLITTPTTDLCSLFNHNLSVEFPMTGLSEPVVIPEIVEEVRLTEYWTRPGDVTGGNRVFSAWGARSNYGAINIEIPYMTHATFETLRGWQRHNPPIVHFTNDGEVTLYKCIMKDLIRKNFRFFHRVICSATINLIVLGEV